MGSGLTYEALLKQYIQIKNELSFCAEGLQTQGIESLYEVGCGSGANLYLFEQDGIRCGGVDYSQSMIECAKTVLTSGDLVCDEAINLETETKYDAILSNSVFSYFVDEKYALEVLERMYKKANYSIGIIDIHDKEKEQDFITYRKKTVKDYEKRYQNLPKLFYSRQFFLDFAVKHHMNIKFAYSNIPGYWNNDFVFQCFMYK